MTAPTDGFMKAPDPARPAPGDDTLDRPRDGVLAHRLRQELRTAEAAHMGDGPGRMVHTRLPMRLVEQAKQRAGITSEEDLLHAALIHLMMDDARHQGR